MFTPNQENQLTTLHTTLKKATAQVESILAAQGTQPESYRRRLGGPLNELGEAEIERRFEAGYADSEIAHAMNVGLSGVSKRRAMWRRKAAHGAAS
jgi:hypothetical protein